MLTVLFSENMDAETKKKHLEKEHSMIMTKEVEGGIQSMCNLGEGLAEKHEKIGEARGERIGKAIGAQKTLVETYQEFDKSKEETTEKLMVKFQVSKEEAEEIVMRFWK